MTGRMAGTATLPLQNRPCARVMPAAGGIPARRGRVCGDQSTMSKSEAATIITPRRRGRTSWAGGDGHAFKKRDPARAVAY